MDVVPHFLKRGYAPGGTYIPVEQVTSVRSLANLGLMTSYEFAKSHCSEVFKLCAVYMTKPMT
jgi:hypothetical protein